MGIAQRTLKMKRLLIGLTLLSSISAFAEKNIFLESFKLPSGTSTIQVLSCNVTLESGESREYTQSLNRFRFNGSDTLTKLDNREDEGSARIKFITRYKSKQRTFDFKAKDFEVESIGYHYTGSENSIRITPEGKHILEDDTAVISCEIKELKVERLSLKYAYKFQAKEDIKIRFDSAVSRSHINLGLSQWPFYWRTERCDIHSPGNQKYKYVPAVGVPFIPIGYNFYIGHGSLGQAGFSYREGYYKLEGTNPSIGARLYSKGFHYLFFRCSRDVKPLRRAGYKEMERVKKEYPLFPMNTLYNLLDDHVDLIF